MFIGGQETSFSSLPSAGSSSVPGGLNENLLNNYVSLLLVALNHNKIYEQLIKIGTATDENTDIHRKSKFLLKKIMFLSSYLLPEVPHFPELIKIATDFDSSDSSVRVTQ